MIRFESYGEDGYYQVVQGTGRTILAIQKDERGDTEVATFDPPVSFTLTPREARQLAVFMERLEGKVDA